MHVARIKAKAAVTGGGLHTMTALARRKLRALIDGLELQPTEAQAVREVFGRLTHPWLDAVPGAGPRWPSDITDDHSPFEFSVSMQGQQRLMRILVEAQDQRMAEHKGWEPGLRLAARLARRPGVTLARFQRIQDLFAPERRLPRTSNLGTLKGSPNPPAMDSPPPQAGRPAWGPRAGQSPAPSTRFSLWHAAEVTAGGPPLYKVYLNPGVLGREAAPGLVREALERLGLPEAWQAVQRLLAVADAGNELLYFALDLSDTPEARAKVYVGHHGVRTDALEHQLAAFPRYERGDASWLARTLTDSDGPFTDRPPITCLSFVPSRPHPAVTLHFPVRSYARDDEQVVTRVARMLGEVQGRRFCSTVGGFAGRRLAAGRGLITYLSMRRTADHQRRLVAYMSPEAYGVQPVSVERAPPALRAPVTMLSVCSWVADHQARIARDPFIQRLRGPGDVALEALALGLTFFVMAFQDVLRLTATLVSDPQLAPLARTHQAEDAGHDRWFLHDLRKLGVEAPVEFLFSDQHLVPREVGYALVSEVLQAACDRQRLAVVFALEAAGHEFFAPAIAQFERRRPGAGLRYFARQHQKVEGNHELYEQGVQRLLGEVVLSDETAARVRATVDRSFGQLHRLADHLLAQIDGAAEVSPPAGLFPAISKEHSDRNQPLDDRGV